MTMFEIGQTARVDELVTELQRTPGWPVNVHGDFAYAHALIADFPRLNLTAEVHKWQSDRLGPPRRKIKTKERLGVQFRKWCVIAARSPAGAARSRAARTSTSPRPAEAFGPSSSAACTGW